MSQIRPGNGPSVTPNYVDPPTRPPAVQVTSIVFGAAVTASLVLRLYTRVHIKHRFEVDDIFAIFATLLTDASFVVQVILFDVYHQGRHTWDIPPSDIYNMQKFGLVYIILFAQAACQIKLSLLFFSRKMMGTAISGTFHPHYICLITLIVIVALCQILIAILSCVQCLPIKAIWDPYPTYPYKCFNSALFYSISGIINTVTDFLCTILPTFIVLKLHMPLRKRVGFASLFLVGILVNVASALRIYYLFYETETSDSWDFLPSSICSNLELGLGLLCVNVPSLRPFFRHYKSFLVDYVRSHSVGSKYFSGDRSYIQSAQSDRFPVSDNIEAIITNNGEPPVYTWRKTGGDTDGIEVLRTVELDAVGTPGSKKYLQRNKSDEAPLQRYS